METEKKKRIFFFLGKTHSDKYLAKLKLIMSGANNPMAGKPVNDKIKEAIRATQNKPVYLYDFHFKEFIRVIPNQTQAYLEFKVLNPK